MADDVIVRVSEAFDMRAERTLAAQTLQGNGPRQWHQESETHSVCGPSTRHARRRDIHTPRVDDVEGGGADVASAASRRAYMAESAYGAKPGACVPTVTPWCFHDVMGHSAP